MKNFKLERLLKGEFFITSEKGNSMTPIIKSEQNYIISPAQWTSVVPGDIVYCRVHGRFYTHLVKAKNPERGCLISNNHGRINGWTKQIFGKVTEIL